MQRNSERLSRRMKNIAPKCAKVDPSQIETYFKNLEETIKDIPACNIVNYGDTNLSDDPGCKKVHVPERN